MCMGFESRDLVSSRLLIKWYMLSQINILYLGLDLRFFKSGTRKCGLDSGRESGFDRGVGLRLCVKTPSLYNTIIFYIFEYFYLATLCH